MTELHHSVVIIGGGSAGIAVASSLLRRKRDLDVAIVEPGDTHYYQPGWTMVGGGIFNAPFTRRAMTTVIPRGVKRVNGAVATFQPDTNHVTLQDGTTLGYDLLIAAPGLKLDWAAVEGLEDTLGQNGVTSNYRYDLAPYTWRLVQGLSSGKAIFTQPPMPIKCAGAPQKAMYLSCYEWERQGRLNGMEVTFCNAGAALFGVAAYVPPLMEYVNRYGAILAFNENLVRIDGPGKVATFAVKDADGNLTEKQRDFDMIHVVPPQTGHDFIKASPLSDDAGWIDVDQATLRHKRFGNIFALGDACSAPNAKTAAAARKQAPIVAENALAVLANGEPAFVYDGYGSCPLTVERGKVILAEFGYGGKLLPSFPWDSTKPRWAGWFLKATALPWLYWNAMLKGREWLARPGRG